MHISLMNSLLIKREKKLTISFPSQGDLWRFFETSDLKAFRLDSSKRTLTGRFLSFDIEKAQREMNAVIQKAQCN